VVRAGDPHGRLLRLAAAGSGSAEQPRKSEEGAVPCGISPSSIRTLRRPGFGYLSPASRCRRRPRPESLRPRSPCAFRHRSPARAFPPSIEISGCPQISRNPGRPVFRGSSGRPALPEIRFRSFGDAGFPVPPLIRRPAATPVSRCCCDPFPVTRGPRLPAAHSHPVRLPWTPVARRPWRAARFRVRPGFPRRPAPRSEAPGVPVARHSLNLVRPS
jgi:hypothetical protein